MAVGRILTLGFGSFGGAKFLPTLGYLAGIPVPPSPPPVVVPETFGPTAMPFVRKGFGHGADDEIDFLDHRKAKQRQEESIVIEVIKTFLGLIR